MTNPSLLIKYSTKDFITITGVQIDGQNMMKKLNNFYYKNSYTITNMSTIVNSCRLTLGHIFQYNH